MFLEKDDQKARSSALEALLGHVDSIESGKLGKKPVAAAVEVTKVEPVEGDDDLLEKAMSAAGHEGVEAAEGELFPAEEAAEETGGIDEESKKMIEELYNRFCR